MSNAGSEVTSHHDGHGLTERIHVIRADEPGPGGAHHLYQFYVEAGSDNSERDMVGFLQFQKGPRNEEGSTPGVLTVAVLAALIDIAQDFQEGEFPSDENAAALYFMKRALAKYKERADKRAARGVLGFNKQ
jgi:hypothetical protein